MQSLRVLWGMIAAIIPLCMMALWLTPPERDVHAKTKVSQPAAVQPQVAANPVSSGSGQQATTAPAAPATSDQQPVAAGTSTTPPAGDQAPVPASSTGDQALPQITSQGMAPGQNPPTPGQSQ